MLHEGTDDITTQRAQEVLTKFEFVTMGMHRIKIGEMLALNVAKFCEEICLAIEAWYDPIRNYPEVLSQMQKIIQVKTEGYSPIPGVQFG